MFGSADAADAPLEPSSGGDAARHVLWGTSFDATPISGVVVEFVKLAHVFQRRGYRVHLDVGYDIKEDKNSFFKPYRDESAHLPPWVTLDRVHGLADVAGYDAAFVRRTLAAVRDGGDLPPGTDEISRALRDRILATWRRLGVSVVIVENGTLPENVAYTRALYAAIAEYGYANRLGRFVLWRDHDMMWSSEPGSGKYGAFPYPGTVRPVNSPYIQYLTLHDEARRRTLEWMPGLRHLEVLPNTFRYDEPAALRRGADFRRHFDIPAHATLVARYTRIIPQKRIDRDIELTARLRALLAERGVDRPVYLFVAGDPAECPAESRALRALAHAAGIADHVIFGGRLAPHGAEPDPTAGFSVGDLLTAADVASFLTAYDYESYGNPIGEAIASGVPYLSTRYQLYDTVYGDKGFHAPLLEITAADDEPVSPEFVAEVAELVTNPTLRRRVAAFNHARGRRYFAANRAELLVDGLLDPVTNRPAAPTGPPAATAFPARVSVPPLGPHARLSVVLPVYNEADAIDAALESLAAQRGDDGPLDRGLFEIILVDNNSTDATVALCRAFAARHPDLAVHMIGEPEQGVSCARRAGMDLAAARCRARDGDGPAHRRFYLVSADADCQVGRRWLWELLTAMDAGKAAIGVCDYHYRREHFATRPRLWDAIDRTLRCRQVTFGLFGGFPDGKGFAVDRRSYERVGGIELSYQLRDGRFLNHLSDDWDFGIRVRAHGEEITYVPRSRVEINPRRVDHAIDEVIAGRAYGSGGIITMRDIRPRWVDPDPGLDPGLGAAVDLTEAQAVQAWEFSIKDFIPKNMVLPVLLTPSLLDDDAVVDFFTPALAARLGARIAEIKEEMRVLDLVPIHSYKTPSYRLYFEFAGELFARLRATVGPDIGYPPPLPDCLQDIRDQGDAARFRDFVRYFCEDRESGEAHDYFGNGGVF